MVEPIVILIALIAGLLFRLLGFPPLLGYLSAGFLANGLSLGDAASLNTLVDLGITLLLFNIGLKVNLKELVSPQVWAVAGLHMAIVVPLTAALILVVAVGIPSLAIENAVTAWTLAFALSFSSTVFAVKIFEERGETISLHAAIAIGILIIQDIAAVIFLVLSADYSPSIWALALLALPLLRPILLNLLNRVGHGELLVLLGFGLALGSHQLFESLHLKGGLGALIVGLLLGGHAKTNELYKSLTPFKDLFLVGFFLQIGYYGFPSLSMVWVALALSVLLLLRPMIYFGLLALFRLRARTAFLASLSLFNYSEFGLIVAALANQAGLLSTEWVTTLALALSLSFFIATPFNTRAHALFRSSRSWLNRLERPQRLDEDRLAKLGKETIFVMGMGRVGIGAYRYLTSHFKNDVLGIEENMQKAQDQQNAGIRCIQADATDLEFWEQANLPQRRMILISLSNHQENMRVVKLLKNLDFSGAIATVSRFPDQKQELEALGCIVFDLYAEAGFGFSEHVLGEVAKKHPINTN